MRRPDTLLSTVPCCYLRKGAVKKCTTVETFQLHGLQLFILLPTL